jgi:hypothetical protein
MKFRGSLIALAVLSSTTYLQAIEAHGYKYTGLFYDDKNSHYYVNGDNSFSIKSIGKNKFIDRIEVSIDNGDFQSYSGKIDFSTEGFHLVRFKAVDPVSNWSPVQTFRIYMDKTAPQSHIVWDNQTSTEGSKFMKLGSRLKLQGTDKLSGISKVLYRLNDGPLREYNKPIYLNKPGSHKIEISAIDKVGNAEPFKTYNFSVDGSSPQVSAKISGQGFQTKKELYVNKGSEIQLFATDEGVGVSKIEYRINNSSIKEYFESIPIEEQSFSLKYRALDKVGNYTAWKNFKVKLDTEPPVLSIRKNGKHLPLSGKVFALPGFSLKALSWDKKSGTKHYIIDKEVVPFDNKDKSLLTFNTPGNYQVSLQSEDYVGNVANTKSYDIVIDNKAPVTSMTSTNSLLPQGDVYVTSLPNKITFNALDNAVGVKRIEVSYNGKDYWEYKAPIDLATWGTKERSVYFRSIDKLGNREEAQKINLFIQKAGPNVALFVENEEVGDIPLSKVKRMDQKKLINGSRMPASVKKKEDK